MGTRSKQQKEQVNDKHCCVCFKLRTAILLGISVSIILIIAYGYEYWTDPKSREDDASKFYGYLCCAGIEVILNIIGWIGVYNHIRSITKYFLYVIIIHILIIIIVFWVSGLFDYLHFGFYIGWVVVQLILLFLLWRFKQLLKMVYGWGDDEENQEEEEQEEEIEAEPIAPKKEEPKDTNNNSNVRVSINVNIPQQQQQPVGYAQQPMIQPMQSIPQQPMGYPQQMMYQQQHPSMQHIPQQPMQQMQQMPIQQQQQQQQYPNAMRQGSHNAIKSQPEELYKLQSKPPVAPHSPIRNQVQQNTVQQQQKLRGLSDVAQQADPPINSNIVASRSNDDDSSSENGGYINQQMTDQNGQVRISVVDHQNTDANEAKMNEEIYNTARWQNTNQQPYTTGSGNKEGMEEGDNMMIQHDETLNEIPPPNGPPPPEAYAVLQEQTRARKKTPDPPPPPNNMDRIISNASDNAVMYNDFNIAEAQPELQSNNTKGVNLYFLDPGDQQTKGVPNNDYQ